MGCMREGEDGRGKSPRPLGTDPLDDRSLDTPNCPECLTRMEIEESAAGEPYWSCATCGLAAIV